MTSKLTREELLNIIETDHVQCGEASALARMALAAMDSEPVADVVAWHREGEERTCDIRWRRHDVEPGPLYRHAQPARTGVDDDVRNIIGLLETNEWAEHCTETVLGSRLEAEITRLIGCAPPAPVVPDERAAFNAWNNEDNLPIAGVGAKNAAWLAWQARALLCGNSVLDVPPERPADSSDGDDVGAWFDEGWNACRAAMLNGGKS